MSCLKYKSDLEDLLFDGPAFAATPAGERALLHVESCADCREELAGLRATMDLLDAWQAPEVSPYFDTRMAVRIREEASAQPAGFWERVKARWHMGSQAWLKPVAAGALAVLVAVGGATFAGSGYWNQPNQVERPAMQESATVRDLQSMDRNAQALEALQALDQDSNDAGDSTEATQ